MKTAVVMQLEGGQAVLLCPGGEFVNRPAKPGWAVGSVVPLAPQKGKAIPLRRWLAAAACLVLFAAAGFAGYGLQRQVAAIISVDVNPSFELEVNHSGTVIDYKAYNSDATAVLESLNLRGKAYREALETLLNSEEMRPYLQANEYLELSVYAPGEEEEMLAQLRQLAAQVTAHHPQMQVNASGVDGELVQQAHAHGITAGTLHALRELEQLDPEANMETYGEAGIGAIRQRIHECHQQQNEEDGEKSQHEGDGHSTQSSGDKGNEGHEGNGGHEGEGGGAQHGGH